jgi:hypothetical protein
MNQSNSKEKLEKSFGAMIEVKQNKTVKKKYKG